MWKNSILLQIDRNVKQSIHFLTFIANFLTFMVYATFHIIIIWGVKAMHFKRTNFAFIDRVEESWVLNNRETEYAKYDYDYTDDILPHIINSFTNERVFANRKLENIRLFDRNGLIGMVVRDFEFMDNDALAKMHALTINPDISMLIFINCRFASNTISVPRYGLGFYDCVFEERFGIDICNGDGLFDVEIRKCTINSRFDIRAINIDSCSIVMSDCVFNENSTFSVKDWRLLAEGIFGIMKIYDCIFKGDVTFENASLQMSSTFENLTFYREVNFNNVKMAKEVVWKNICFAPFVNKVEKYGFKTFVEALSNNGYKSEAKFFDTHYGEPEAKKVDKTEYDIAVESGWLNIKQAALYLGVKYSSLLDMRKDDKILGVQRIPYIGEGKNSRYYVPLLQAYKIKDMKKVAELEKEMRQKENEV